MSAATETQAAQGPGAGPEKLRMGVQDAVVRLWKQASGQDRRAELLRIRQLFDSFDQDRDDRISAHELEAWMEKRGKHLTESELQGMFNVASTNRKHAITFDDFFRLCTAHPRMCDSHEQLIKTWQQAAFETADAAVVAEVLSKSQSKQQLGIRSYQSLIAGGVAGGCAKTTIAPFDRAKILFQVSDSCPFSFRACGRVLKDSYKKGGISYLFRGNGCMLIRSVPYAAIQYMSFEQYKQLFRVLSRRQESPASRFICGAMAGATSVTFTYPLDFLRARLATSPKSDYNGITHAIKVITQTEGLVALTRGLGPTLLGIVPYAGMSFASFETIKAVLLSRPSTQANQEPGYVRQLTAIQRLVIGGFSGVMAQTATYPLDVVRRRMQTDRKARYKNTFDALKQIAQKEGILGGWYKGVSMNFVKSPIAVGISFTVYDFLKTRFIMNNNKIAH